MQVVIMVIDIKKYVEIKSDHLIMKTKLSNTG
jgi:hypothetical protein